MPAGSEPADGAAPPRRARSESAGTSSGRARVFRPRKARRVIYSCIGLVLAAFIGGSVALPATGPGSWALGSRLALAAVGLAIAYFLHRLASVRVLADENGATIVNIVHSHRLDWPQIVGVRLSADDPWLVLDLSNGETVLAMGVQRSEGELAQRQASQFARLVNEHTHASDS